MRRWLQSLLLAFPLGLAISSTAVAGAPTDLLRGEAPLLFTGAEGEDADTTLLLDGQPIRGDEIWLWVPAITAGQVDLGIIGKFFRIWDSGPEAGPDGNDDDRNGMRGMDFDPSTGTWLISYDDTTTGFAFGNILDGDLIRMTPTSVSGGFITGFTLSRPFNECTNGTAGCIGTGDLNALCSASDGTLYAGMGGTQTIQTDVPGTLSVTGSTLAHLDPAAASGSPENIGPDRYFEGSVSDCGVIFCPSFFTGSLRGADVLEDGLLTFGAQGDWRNTVFTGPIDGLTDPEAEALAIDLTGPICQMADICSLPEHGNLALNTYQRRTAEVLYPGGLFFQSPNVGNAGMLDHDILDTPAEVLALINVLGSSSPAGMALSDFVDFVPSCGGAAGDGDANQDGSVNGRDIQSFLAILLNGAFSVGDPEFCASDTTPNDSVDIGDIGTFVIALLN